MRHAIGPDAGGDIYNPGTDLLFALLAVVVSALAFAFASHRQTRDELAASAAKVDPLSKEVDRLRAENAQLGAALAHLRAELASQAKDFRDREAKLKAQIAGLQTQLAAALKRNDELALLLKTKSTTADDANAAIIDLQREKKKLADALDQHKRDAENKFAGIAMTGTRVVFLVDMSGSMDKLDANTPAPNKWPTVCETVAKVMRSIPNPEAFQVVVFARQARWLFGNGEWQAFDGEKSAADVKEALLRVKPENDTNLYAGMEMAFTLRPGGLDTVYLFSDGLPTSGPGLSAVQDSMRPPLPELERSDILAKHIRGKLNADWNRARNGRKVRINAIGFFYESPDVGAFLWALSRENDGSFVGMSKP